MITAPVDALYEPIFVFLYSPNTTYSVVPSGETANLFGSDNPLTREALITAPVDALYELIFPFPESPFGTYRMLPEMTKSFG